MAEHIIIKTDVDTNGNRTDYIKINGIDAKFATYNKSNEIIFAYDRFGRSVEAKYLKDSYGNNVLDPDTKQAYIVPVSYKVEYGIEKVREILNSTSQTTSPSIFLKIAKQFSAGGSNDIQRSYNGMVGGGGNEFVPAFTSAATFHYAYALKENGYSSSFIKSAGGFYNLYSKILNGNSNQDISGEYWNNPNNLNDFNKAFEVYDKNIFNHKYDKFDLDFVSLDVKYEDNQAIILTQGNSRHIIFLTDDKKAQEYIKSKYLYKDNASNGNFIISPYNLSTSDISDDEKTNYYLNKNYLNSLSQDNDITVSGTLTAIGDEAYYVVNQTANIVISGVTYLAGNVVQAGNIAYNALYDFAAGNNTAGSALVSASIDGAMYETLGKIGAMFVSGQRPTALDIIKMFAQTLGYKFASNVVTETDMGKALSSWIDSQIGISGYGGAVTSGIINFGLQTAFSGKNWNSDDYARTGVSALAAAVVPVILAKNFASLTQTDTAGKPILDALGIPKLTTAGGSAAAAVATIVVSIINNPKMNSGEYAMMGVQAGIAGASYAIGVGAASLAVGTALAPFTMGLSIVVGIIAGAVMNEIVGAFYSGKQFNAGDFETRNAAEDALWRFAHITVKDTNNKDVTVDAVYSFGVNGHTLNYDEIIARNEFRVIENANLITGNYANPTVVGAGKFKPTYYVGADKTDTGRGADNIVASNLNDVIMAGTGSDYIDAKGGDNVIYGDGQTETSVDGSDVLLAKNGNDMIMSGGGDDYVSDSGGNNMIILGSGNDRAYTGDGIDNITGGNGEDYIEAGNGNNIIKLGNVVYDDAGKVLKNDTDFTTNEAYTGYGNDIITGSSGNDVVMSDWLSTEDANIDAVTDAMMVTAAEAVTSNNFANYFVDNISAGRGNDLVVSGLGNDNVHGDAGNDVIIGGGMPDDVSALAKGTLYTDMDMLYGDAGDDIILGDSMAEQNYASYYTLDEMEQIKLSRSNDYIDGGIGNDYIDGGSGNDSLVGGLGDDVLVGGTGNDKISGSDGSDFMIGGTGNDILQGGTGKYDYYVFSQNDGTDTIIDGVGSDRILFDDNNFAELKFKRSGNNLEITTTQGGKVIIKDHYNGKSLDWVYDKNNNLYAIGGQSVSDGAYFTPTPSTGDYANVGDVLDARIQGYDGNYKDVTSPFAVNEASSWYDNNYFTAYTSSIDNVQINGTQIGFTKRKRSPLGGHYNVWFHTKNSVLNGTEQQTIILDSLGTVNIDAYSNKDEYEFIKVNYDGTIIDENAKFYNQNSQKVYEYEIAVTDDFNDLIVGAYWNETINAYGGDDAVFGGVGSDTIYGGQGNDMVHGGTGADNIYGDIANGIEYFAKDYFADILVKRYLPRRLIWDSGSFMISILEMDKNIETNHDLLFGGTGNDNIWGQLGNDTLFGDSGNDVIDAGDGDDNSEGNSGNDVINDMIGNAIVDGGSGNDTITTGGGIDLIKGGSGNDFIKSNYGNDTIFGNSGNDIIWGSSGSDFIHGGDDHDTLDGGSGNDIVLGGNGNDVMYGSTGNDSLMGGYGHDVLYGGLGRDLLDGGAGFDEVFYKFATTGVILNMGVYKNTGTDEASGDVLIDIERVYGSNFNDDITGDEENNIIYGLSGSDTLRGMAGDDTLYGETGSNTLDGGDGSDKIYGGDEYDLMYGGAGIDYIYGYAGNDKIYGLDGNDYLYASTGNDYISGGLGDDTLYAGDGTQSFDGGDGTDLLSYYYATSSVSIDIYAKSYGGQALGDTITSIERLYATNFNDVLKGDNNINYLYGYNGIVN